MCYFGFLSWLLYLVQNKTTISNGFRFPLHLNSVATSSLQQLKSHGGDLSFCFFVDFQEQCLLEQQQALQTFSNQMPGNGREMVEEIVIDDKPDDINVKPVNSKIP